MYKYQPTATRKNLPGKPAYTWRAEYSNGRPVLFETEREALECARAKCADPAHGLHHPRAERVTQ
jgi:hypothetical protein